MKQHKANDNIYIDTFPARFDKADDVAKTLMLKLSGQYNWQGMLSQMEAPAGLQRLANLHLRNAVKSGRISDSWKIYEAGSDGTTSNYHIGNRK